MRLNGPFLKNFTSDNSRRIALHFFFSNRYHLNVDSLPQLNSFMDYLAVKMKDTPVCYGSLDKCYEDWKQYGADKKIDVSRKDIESLENRLSTFIGLKKCAPLSDENRKILYSFLAPNDAGMFYVYVNYIDIFYWFLQYWTNDDIREYAEIEYIPKYDRLVFDIFSFVFSDYPKILKKILLFIGKIIIKSRMKKCAEYINILYSMEGFEFDENSVTEKVSIMNILAEIYECIKPFNDSILFMIHFMNIRNFRTGELFDNYLIQCLYGTLTERSLKMKNECDVTSMKGYNVQNTMCTVEKYWPLPENYFELTSAGKNDFLGDVKDDIKDVVAFEKFINYLAAEGYIEDDDLSKRVTAFVLTGKGKPNEDVNMIEWKIGRNELAYMCQQIYAFNGKFQRIPLFFNYENKGKKLTSNYAENASVNFKQKMEQFFPALKKR